MTTLIIILVILFSWSMWQFLKAIYIPAYRQGLPVHHACLLLLFGVIMSVIVMMTWPFWIVYRLYQIVVDILKR